MNLDMMMRRREMMQAQRNLQKIGKTITQTGWPSLLNIIKVIEDGNFQTGTFTPANIYNTETAYFEFQWQEEIHGILIMDESYKSGSDGSDVTYWTIGLVDSSAFTGTEISDGQLFYHLRAGGGSTNRNQTTLLSQVNGWRMPHPTVNQNDNKFYVTARYTNNASYTPFVRNHTYRWVIF